MYLRRKMRAIESIRCAKCEIIIHYAGEISCHKACRVFPLVRVKHGEQDFQISLRKSFLSCELLENIVRQKRWNITISEKRFLHTQYIVTQLFYCCTILLTPPLNNSKQTFWKFNVIFRRSIMLHNNINDLL